PANEPARARRSNSSSERNQYSTPSASAGRCGRVVADTATSSTGIRSTSSPMSVPFPAPDGPVTTKTGRAATSTACLLAAVVEEVDEFGALALGESADGLRLADAALVQEPGRLHPSELRDGHEHVEDLGRRDELRRLE